MDVVIWGESFVSGQISSAMLIVYPYITYPFPWRLCRSIHRGVKLEDDGHHYYPTQIERALIILTSFPPYRILSMQQSLKYIVINMHTLQAS